MSSSFINTEEQLIDLYNQIPPELVAIIVDYIPPIEFRYISHGRDHIYRNLEWIGQFTVGRMIVGCVSVSFGKHAFCFQPRSGLLREMTLTSKIVNYSYGRFVNLISGFMYSDTQRIRFSIRRLDSAEVARLSTKYEQLSNIIIDPSSCICYISYRPDYDEYWIVKDDQGKLLDELLEIRDRLVNATCLRID